MIKNYLDKPGLDTYDKGVKSRLGLKATKAELDEERQRVDGELSVTPIAERVVDEDTFPEFKQWTVEGIGKELFIKLWNDACKLYNLKDEYNRETDSFDLNGVTGITFDEAITIFKICAGNLSIVSGNTLNGRFATFAYGKKLRTVFPIYYAGTEMKNAFRYQDKLEAVTFMPQDGDMGVITDIRGIFYNCSSLKRVNGEIKLWFYYYTGYADNESFYNCQALESINIRRLSCNLNLRWSPLLNLNSFKYMVQNCGKAADTAITITVHPDVYAKMTSDDYPEWQQLVNDAVAKNISFATV